MNILVKVVFPVDSGNAAVADPGFGATIQKIYADQKAEAVYFHPSGGQRAISYVSDVSDGSRIPSLVEPWWLRLCADVTLTPVFTPKEMEKGRVGNGGGRQKVFPRVAGGGSRTHWFRPLWGPGFVIPVKTGIQSDDLYFKLDSRERGNDKVVASVIS